MNISDEVPFSCSLLSILGAARSSESVDDANVRRTLSNC